MITMINNDNEIIVSDKTIIINGKSALIPKHIRRTTTSVSSVGDDHIYLNGYRFNFKTLTFDAKNSEKLNFIQKLFNSLTNYYGG